MNLSVSRASDTEPYDFEETLCPGISFQLCGGIRVRRITGRS